MIHREANLVANKRGMNSCRKMFIYLISFIFQWQYSILLFEECGRHSRKHVMLDKESF